MRRRRPFLLALGLGCWALVLFSATSALAADVPILRLAGPAQTLTLTAAEFAALPRTELRAIETHENKERLYSGVTVRELLTRVGAPLGDKMRGPALALGVLVRTKDDYAVLFYLADFDSAFSTRTLLLADREDGAAPPATAAPFRLVAPGGSRGARWARWARMVTSIEIISIPVKP